jgi:hypothetical protein
MRFTSWVFPKGHRVHFAVHNAQWPMIWPTAYPATTSLRLGGPEATRVLLPVVPREERPRPHFLPPEKDPERPGFRTLEKDTMSGYGEIARIDRDVARRATKVVATNGRGTQYPWGTKQFEETITHEAENDHPEIASVRREYRTTVTLKERTLTWESLVTWRSDRDNFYYNGVRRLTENGKVVRQKVWQDAIPHDFQ